MRLDEERESSNYEVQGGRPGLGGGRGLGGSGNLIGLLLPLIGRRFGCVGLVAVLAVLAFLNFGGQSLLSDGSGGLTGPQGAQGPSATPGPQASPNQGQLTDLQHFSLKVLGSTERVWGQLFQESGGHYQPTILSFYSREGTSGCGAAQSAMGPFYCPRDKKVYLDTDFYRELGQRYGAKGDFAAAYVIAHEVGHHIQDLQGTLAQVNEAQKRLNPAQANALQVRVELQADCYAGVWGKRSGILEAGDIEEGMRAAQAIGDDTLQREAGRRPMPDSFTHGTSAQRMNWLKRGLDDGDPSRCDTFRTPT